MATKKTTKKEQSEKKYKKWKKLDTSVLGTAKKGRTIREEEAAKKGVDISDREAKAEFGQYKEGNGGGEPMGQGTKYPKGGRGVWTEEYGQEPKRDKGQPRTADGKFTYNSVNGKGLKYESRGETVNPLLTGGKNGVKIDDVKEQFDSKSGDYWDKYKDIWYDKGSKAVMVSKDKKGYTAPHTVVAHDSIWEIAKRYNPETGEFTAKLGSKLTERENWKSKAGARSKEEKAEHQKAAKGKSERFMQDKAGGIAKYEPSIDEIMAELPPLPAGPTPTAPSPTPTVPTPTAPTTSPTVSAAPTPAAPTGPAGKKYTSDDVSKVKDYFSKKFGSSDPENLKKIIAVMDNLGKTDPEKLDTMIDTLVSKGMDFGFAKPEAPAEEKEAPTPAPEGESDYEKKLKSKMGLTD